MEDEVGMVFFGGRRKWSMRIKSFGLVLVEFGWFERGVSTLYSLLSNYTLCFTFCPKT